MLAITRFFSLLTTLLVFPLLLFVCTASLPGAAQVQGVPASVTSLGFGGSTNPTPGVRASVTSLKPNAYGYAQPFLGNCCANYSLWSGYWPYVNPPLAPEHHRRHRDDQIYVSVAVPAYIPYGVPYAADPDDDAANEADAYDSGSGGAGTAGQDVTAKHSVRHSSGRRTGQGSTPDSSPKETAPAPSEDPVVVQPATVLVFKDGHRTDVVNYAIVGDTLFDFADGRARKILLADLDLAATQKVNDDHGVDFKVPPAGK
jgi:hypothetical protein